MNIADVALDHCGVSKGYIGYNQTRLRIIQFEVAFSGICHKELYTFQILLIATLMLHRSFSLFLLSPSPPTLSIFRFCKIFQILYHSYRIQPLWEIYDLNHYFGWRGTSGILVFIHAQMPVHFFSISIGMQMICALSKLSQVHFF